MVTFRSGAHLCYTEGQTCLALGLCLQRFNRFFPKQNNLGYDTRQEDMNLLIKLDFFFLPNCCLPSVEFDSELVEACLA